MKVDFGSNRTIQKSNLQDEGNFRIKATGKAFDILSSGLYSDKVTAIIRELSTNALDAHIAAGNKDKPFDVHLPNTFEPWFSIRDYGIGLSRDDTMHLYTTYFESTKTSSDDFVGALGLGSKSPFSYVDMFSVTSWHGGLKSVYSAFLSEDRVPSIALMHQEKSTEPNGLEISMAVKNNDYAEFAEKAKNVLKRFKTLPTITGNTIDIKPVEYVLTGNGWGIRQEERSYNYYYNSNRGPVAIQGCIGYPVNTSNLNGTRKYHWFSELDIDMHFEIGSLNFAASRESLSYDKKTQQNIIDRLDIIISEISQKVSDEFKNCQTLWEAKQLYSKLFGSRYHSGNSTNTLRRIVNNGHVDVTFRGQKLYNGDMSIEMKEYPNITLHVFSEGWRRETRYKDDSNHETFSFSPSDKVIFVKNDLKIGAVGRCELYYKNNTSLTVALIRNDQPLVEHDDIDKLLKYVEGAKVINASELDKPPVQRKDKVTQLYKFNLRRKLVHSQEYRDFFDPTNLDITDTTGWFVPLKRGIVQKKIIRVNAQGDTEIDYVSDVDDIPTIKEHAVKLKVMPSAAEVYGISTKFEAKALSLGWKNLLDELETVTKKGYQTNQNNVSTANWKEYQSFTSNDRMYRELNWINDFVALCGNLSINFPVGPMKDFFEAYDVCKNAKKPFDAPFLAQLFGVDTGVVTAKAAFDLKCLFNQMVTSYPLLSYIIGTGNLKRQSDVFDIIKYVESKNKTEKS